jgi:uncharacterized membrane protein (UPF0127 family)
LADALQLTAATGGGPTWKVAVAASWLARLRGLIGRPSLASGEGLYLPGTNGVHMLFMRFAIDCLFVGAPRADGARPVVGVRHNLAPWTGVVWWVRGARGVVELPAGALAGSDLAVGDYVRLEPVA